jgi:hypothetical protein
MAKYSNMELLLKKVNKDLEDVRTEFYKGLVEVLVANSPVDTGAYMNSHSVSTDTTSGAAQKSDGLPRKQPEQEVKGRNLTRLFGEIDSLPPDATKVYIANRSPHSKTVEDGSWWPGKDGYYPFKIMRSRAKVVLDAAVAQVKGRSS